MSVKTIITKRLRAAARGSTGVVEPIKFTASDMRKIAVEWSKEESEIFKKNSTGYGEWPPRESDFRRHRKTTKTHPILIDTGTLFGGIGIRSIQILENEFTFQFTDRQHPKAKMSVEELAEIHHQGKGNMPKRTIIHKSGPRYEAIISKLKEFFDKMMNK